MLAFFNWSELPGSTSIWQGYLRDVFPKLSRRKQLFLDLSDCSQRPDSEIREAAGLIRQFSRYVDTVLSLNQNEAETLAKVWSFLWGTRENCCRPAGAALLRYGSHPPAGPKPVRPRQRCGLPHGASCSAALALYRWRGQFQRGICFRSSAGTRTGRGPLSGKRCLWILCFPRQKPHPEELAAWLQEDFPGLGQAIVT